MTEVQCPHCGTVLQVPPSLLGQTVRCPHCRNALMLGEATPPTMPQPMPPPPPPQVSSPPPLTFETMLPVHRQAVEAQFTAASTRKPGSRKSADDGTTFTADRPTRRREAILDEDEESTSNRGLYIGLGIGGGVLAILLVTVVTLLFVRWTPTINPQIPAEIANADVIKKVEARPAPAPNPPAVVQPVVVKQPVPAPRPV